MKKDYQGRQPSEYYLKGAVPERDGKVVFTRDIDVPGKSSRTNRILLPGELPSPANPPSGCAFHTRCPYARPECSAKRPELQNAATPDDPLRQVACPFAGKL